MSLWQFKWNRPQPENVTPLEYQLRHFVFTIVIVYSEDLRSICLREERHCDVSVMLKTRAS